MHGLLPTLSKAEFAFDALVQIVWGIKDKVLRKKLWRALIRDRSASGANWRYQITALIHSSDSTSKVGRIAFTLISPHEVVRWLERGVAVGRLSRGEANAVMACGVSV
jgi:hypothetical protein